MPRRREPGSPHAFGELDELVWAYASTIHKSQEYPAVVIPLSTATLMLQRNLVCTACRVASASSFSSGSGRRWRLR